MPQDSKARLEEVFRKTRKEAYFGIIKDWALPGILGAEGFKGLLSRLGSLPGFQNGIVIQALGSTENKFFFMLAILGR